MHERLLNRIFDQLVSGNSATLEICGELMFRAAMGEANGQPYLELTNLHPLHAEEILQGTNAVMVSEGVWRIQAELPL